MKIGNIYKTQCSLRFFYSVKSKIVKKGTICIYLGNKKTNKNRYDIFYIENKIMETIFFATQNLNEYFKQS